MENETVTTQVLEQMKDIVSEDLYMGNTAVAWVRAVAIIAVVIVTTVIIKAISKKMYKKTAANHPDEILAKTFLYSNLSMTNVVVAFFLGLYPAIISLKMPARFDQVSKYLFVVSIFVQIMIWANNSLNLYAQKHVQKNPSSATAMNVFSLIWKVIVFSLIIVIMLDQLGFNITALIAGLGVGGIAIAFALQNVLSDVFGSLAIILDKPFKVGDIIRINDFIGRVEKVGLKTTRVRSTAGEQLIFSNNELLKSTIQNFGEIEERRIALMVGVTYETPYEKLKKVPDVIKAAIFSQAGTSVDHVTLKQLADFSLNFEVWYYIQEREKGKWLEIEHNVNLEIVRLFEKEGISFAYPTRTVYTKSL